MTKRFLNEHNLDFKEVDVDEDESAMARLRKLGVKSLPVVEDSNKFVCSGFDQEKMKKAFNL
ncbi:glutaredoxin [Ligilactobacillus ruminis DPC 6832]|uniref:Glutaredoxin n=1 Tax=Ligilactobacillus ruminis DPC 6832 TaxID=1402208 RepID=A0A837DX35_9LACO|nr:glutaredoxin [Ligilactobacillus ruminis DPC 6832]